MANKIFNSLLAGESAPPDPLLVDMYLQMNTASAEGTELTNTILNDTTHAPGLGVTTSWFSGSVPVAEITVSTSRYNRHSPVTADGVTYATDAASKAIAYDNNSGFSWFQFGWSQTDAATVAGIIELGPQNDGVDSSLFDLVKLVGINGGFAVMQLRNGEGAPAGPYAINVETNPSGVTTHSDDIVLEPGGVYWYSLHLDLAAGTASLFIYDYNNNFALVDSVTAVAETGDQVVTVVMGNSEEGTSDGTTYFEQTILDYTNAVQPLGP